jgi:flagellar basal body-associated protein FliL
MFQTIVIGLSIVVLTAIGYVVLKAWRAQGQRQETFQASLQQAPVSVPVPAPAPPVVAQVAEEPPRVVAPAGPNPPSTAPPKRVVTFTPSMK